LLPGVQGRVRTKTTKRSARIIVEKYYMRLTVDFQVNKRVCEEVAIIPTKRLRNKIAGYITVRPPPLRRSALARQQHTRWGNLLLVVVQGRPTGSSGGEQGRGGAVLLV
jgi:ribosomal protein S17E